METGKLQILAIGRNSAVMEVMQRLLNAPQDWAGQAVTADDAAFTAMQEIPYDIILICAGISEEEEAVLRTRFQQLAPAAIITRHYGGGSGLLRNEIRFLLDHRQ